MGVGNDDQEPLLWPPPAHSASPPRTAKASGHSTSPPRNTPAPGTAPHYASHGRYKSLPLPTNAGPLPTAKTHDHRSKTRAAPRPSRLLMGTDMLLSLTLFNWINALFWRGVWGLQRVILPQWALASAIASLMIGAFLGEGPEALEGWAS